MFYVFNDSRDIFENASAEIIVFIDFACFERTEIVFGIWDLITHPNLTSHQRDKTVQVPDLHFRQTVDIDFHVTHEFPKVWVLDDLAEQSIVDGATFLNAYGIIVELQLRNVRGALIPIF